MIPPETNAMKNTFSKQRYRIFQYLVRAALASTAAFGAGPLIWSKFPRQQLLSRIKEETTAASLTRRHSRHLNLEAPPDIFGPGNFMALERELAADNAMLSSYPHHDQIAECIFPTRWRGRETALSATETRSRVPRSKLPLAK